MNPESKKEPEQAGPLHRLSVDTVVFLMAFGRDRDYHDHYPQTTYLDLETGDVGWLYHYDEDAQSEAGPLGREENRRLREEIGRLPARYLEIPGRSHGDHHDILKEFLESDWTTDKKQKATVAECYFGSIGGWLEAVDDDTVWHAYEDFRYWRVSEMATQFLREHGIDPEWK